MEEVQRKTVNMDALKKRVEQLKTIQPQLTQDMKTMKQKHEAKVHEIRARRKALEDEMMQVASIDTEEVSGSISF